MKTRRFKCLESFQSEGRFMTEGEEYHAFVMNDGEYYQLNFDNGYMNFKPSLFEKVIIAWSDNIREV